MSIKEYNILLEEFHNNVAKNKDCTEVVQQIINTQIESFSLITIE